MDMSQKKERLPDYSTIIGKGTEIAGGMRFSGGVHIDGTVAGDVKGVDGCALTLGRSGVIQGDLDVAHVVLDGTVIGDVRASSRAELAFGARIEGNVYYGVLEMAEGAEVNGKLLRIDEVALVEEELHSGVAVDSVEDASASGLGKAPQR
jgi:cytoskeletal protein CcmA (bactofilin family)